MGTGLLRRARARLDSGRGRSRRHLLVGLVPLIAGTVLLGPSAQGAEPPAPVQWTFGAVANDVVPAEGTVRSVVTVTGSGLDEGTRPPVVVMKNVDTRRTSTMTLLEVHTDHLVVGVKPTVPAGIYSISVRIRGVTTYTVTSPTLFTVLAPTDVTVDPDAAAIRETITLSARYLGTARGTVRVGAYAARVVSWQGTTDGSLGTVKFVVPTQLGNGSYNVYVTTRAGRTKLAWGLVVAGRRSRVAASLRLSNAAAVSNTEVLLQFSSAVDPRIAELVDRYRITGTQAAGGPPTQAYVRVLSAEVVRPNLTTVRLTTTPQSEIPYTLKTTAIVDLAGRPIQPPTGSFTYDTSATEFVGAPPNGDSQLDSDDDGVSDADEQRGYVITVKGADGSEQQRAVTSNPDEPDSDLDGVPDAEEKHALCDPRSPDTDGDTLDDNMEWNVVFSNPSDQDSDGDGSQDGVEYYFFKSSPLLADTDGDQINDTDEVLLRSRNPRIADAPAHDISIGDVRLQIDERYTYEDSSGSTVSTADSSSVTLSNGSSSGRSDGESLTFKGALELEGGWGDGSVAPGGPVSRVKPSFGVEHVSQVTKESASEAQRAFEESISKGKELSQGSTVVREIVGARVDADITIENTGNLSFAISDLEITVLQRSRESTRRFIPVATLIANSTLISGDDATFYLGPFTRTRGPILFSSRDVFPNLVEQLMQDPGSLVFQVVNYDVTDELGRHFTFADQMIRDVTGGILIDAGDGQVQRYQVATALQIDPDQISGEEWVGGFAADAGPKGIPLDYALQNILGWRKNSVVPDGIVAGPDQRAGSFAIGDDVQLIPAGTTGISTGSIVIGAGANGVLDSFPIGDDVAEVTTGYETTDDGGVERLVRIGSQRNGDFDRQWVVMTTDDVPAGADFGQLTVMPGEDFYFAFVQDLDQDGIFARTEFLNGSTDSRADVYLNDSFGAFSSTPGPNGFALTAPTLGQDGIPDSKDTDRDGLGDYAETKVGWKVSADGGLLQQVFSSPRLPDSDGDGLLDPQEQDLRAFCDAPGPDPRQDALCTFQGAPAVTKDAAVVIVAGRDGVADTLATGDDVQLVPQGTTGLTYATPVVGAGGNGVVDTTKDSDDEYESTESSRRIPPASNPGLSDTDVDGIEDFDELIGVVVGKAIRDGGTPCAGCMGTAESLAIGDDVQLARRGGPVARGGVVVLPGPNGTIESTPGGNDVTDPGHEVVTDPLRRDTDSDLVADGREVTQGGDPTNPLDAEEFRDLDQDGLSDSQESILGWLVQVNNAAPRLVLSNPSRPDSDLDGLPDLAEQILGTDPNDADTDDDGLRDFDEVENFEQFAGLETENPGFFVDGASSAQYGSNPTRSDTDSDILTDYEEVITGYRILLGGESSFRWIRTNPLVADTDLDGRTDYEERFRPGGATDATDPDTDDDKRTDGVEASTGTDPLVPDVSVTVTFKKLTLDKITDVGGAGGAEIAWFFTMTPPNGSVDMMSNACYTSQTCYWYNGVPSQQCYEIVADPALSYTLPLNNSRTITLRAGQSFSVEGILFELDDASSDCGSAPNYIPSWVRSGCVTRFSKVFEFKDFADGGKASFPFPDGAGTSESCNWTIEVYVTSA